MGSLNFRAPQNGKRGLSTSQRFWGGGAHCGERLSPVQAMLLRVQPMGEGKED